MPENLGLERVSDASDSVLYCLSQRGDSFQPMHPHAPVDTGGRLELLEAKWTELPDVGDSVNLDFVRNLVGKSRVGGGAIVCRTPNSFPLANGFRALP